MPDEPELTPEELRAMRPSLLSRLYALLPGRLDRALVYRLSDTTLLGLFQPEPAPIPKRAYAIVAAAEHYRPARTSTASGATVGGLCSSRRGRLAHREGAARGTSAAGSVEPERAASRSV